MEADLGRLSSIEGGVGLGTDRVVDRVDGMTE